MRCARLIVGITLLALGMTGCDSGFVTESGQYVGTYDLTAHGGAALPAGGVTAGRLRLLLDQTIPTFELEWTREGTRHAYSGVYSVTGDRIELLVASGTELREYAGTVAGRTITLSIGEDGVTTLTYQRR